MSVGDEQVSPAVVIRIHEPGAEADIEVTLLPERCLVDDIRERAVPVVSIEGVGLIREVRNEDIQPTVCVVVGSGDPHPGLCDPVETIGAAGEQRNLTERAIAVVIEKIVAGVVICDVKIRGAIVIEI